MSDKKPEHLKEKIDELKKLKEKILSCDRCGLCKTVKNKLIGKGSINPEILFVAESPSEKEDAEGKIFCDDAGEKFNQIIPYLDGKSYSVINALKCRIPQKRFAFINELDSCKSYLIEQIRVLNPKKIIALGKMALIQLGLSGDTILSRIGTTEKTEFGNVFILPHPHYLIENPNFILPIEKLKKFLNESDDLITLDKFHQNYQQAKNLGTFEMISGELASIHYYCKLANINFVDVNQKDLCKIGNNLAYVKKFEQTNEIDLFEEELNAKLKNVKLFLFYSIEKGNIIWLGYVDNIDVSAIEMGYHFKAEKNCKKIMYDTLKPLKEIFKIMIKKEEEKTIEAQPFVHLHVHSEYSIGDGYGNMSQMAEALYNKGFSACALTDHGTLAGTYYWQKALLEKNIKPIFGYEGYLITEDDGEDKKEKNHHITILVKNEVGWKNLLLIHDLAVRKHFYYRPRILLQDLLNYSEGLIILSGCSGGFVSHMLQDKQPEKAETFLLKMIEAFKEDFYIEMMPNKIEMQKNLNKFLFEFIERYPELNIKWVITADSHYPNAEDEKFHKAVKAINYRKLYEESGFDDSIFYLLNQYEVKTHMKINNSYIVDEFITKAFQYSMEISDKCNFKIEPFDEDTLPKLYDNPKEKITELTIEGLKKFTPYDYSEPKIKERIDLELDRVLSKKYENYFLIVQDYVRWCKNNDIMVGPGRGSVGASLLAMALNITECDPLKYNLLFDRFISEVRKDAPDIDLDFEDDKREKLIKYFKEKYGEEKITRIMTYSTWHAKGALRDVGRIFNIPSKEISKICNLVVVRSGGDARAGFCLLDTFTEFEQAKQFYEKYKMQCEIAIGLEGHIRHRGIHAAAITMTEKPTSEYIPVEKLGGEISTAWEKKAVENMNIIKFDILGLKTLSVIINTKKLIKQNRNIDIELPKDFNDVNVYEKVFKTGKTLGVFQFDTTGLSKLAKQLEIDSFKLTYDATTLYRPGPLHCLNGGSSIKKEGNPILLRELYKKFIKGKKLPKIYNGVGDLVTPKKIFLNGMQETYKLKTKNGRHIIATEEHGFLTKLGWKKLKELKIGDRIIQIKNAVWNKGLNKTDARIKKYSDKHPNAILNKNGRISYKQKELFAIVKNKYDDAILNYQLKTEKAFRFLDVAIPDKKIDFEYDGEYWHKDAKADLKRDMELKLLGWKTVRINKNNFEKFKEDFKNGIY